VKVTRAGLHVRSRSGFLGETDDQPLPKFNTPVEQLRAAMLSPFRSSGVGMRLTALYTEVPKPRGPVVRNLMRINVADLTWEHTSTAAMGAGYGIGGRHRHRRPTVGRGGPHFQYTGSPGQDG